MIGIYKITSPSGRVYIGQSVNIERRWKFYKGLHCKDQPKIYNSLVKYGVENHSFEVVIECKEQDLNKFERYYQELYSSEKVSLNCSFVGYNDISGRRSEETKVKISKALKGRVGKRGADNYMYGKTHSDEVRKFLSENSKRVISENGNPMEGKTHSLEARKKISEKVKGKFKGENNPMFGRNHTDEVKLLISNKNKGRVQSEEEKQKRTESRKKYFASNDGYWKGKTRGKSPSAKKVINTITNEIFECAKDAADSIQMNYGTLKCQLNGHRRNKTIFKYLE